jgi:hypothetical protein
MTRSAASSTNGNGITERRKPARHRKRGPITVVIARPASPESTEKLFRITKARSEHIKGLVDQVLG